LRLSGNNLRTAAFFTREVHYAGPGGIRALTACHGNGAGLFPDKAVRPFGLFRPVVKDDQIVRPKYRIFSDPLYI
jgi:hypothetical protein